MLCRIYGVVHMRMSSLFSFPLRFFIRFIARSDPLFCDIVSLLGYSSPTNLISSSCVYFLYMASTTLFPCFFMNFLAFYCVNVTSMAILCMSCIKYVFLFPVLVNWVSYFLPPKFVSRRSTNFLALSLLGLLLVFSRSLVFISPASVFLLY